MILEDLIIDELRTVGAKGISFPDLANRAVEKGHAPSAAYSTIAALIERQPRVVECFYHGPKKGRLLYLPGLRPLSRQELIRRYLDERYTAPKGQCHVCKTALPKGRSRWCSDSCADRYLGLINASFGRVMAYRESQACAICAAPLFVSVKPGVLGHDGETFYEIRLLDGTRVERSQKTPVGFVAEESGNGWGIKWKQARTPEMREAELDHVVPLVEGGDHDWHNLRLICKPCHADETAKLAARRAEKRRHEKRKPSLPGVAE